MANSISRRPVGSDIRYKGLFNGDQQYSEPPPLNGSPPKNPHWVTVDEYQQSNSPSVAAPPTVAAPVSRYGLRNWVKWILFAEPWEHEQSEPDQGLLQTSRAFDRGRQRRRMLIKGLRQLLVTVFLCSCLFGVLKYYSTRYMLSQNDKYRFNALTVGLSILLGLATVASFKTFAQLMRWRFLATRYYDIEIFSLILGPVSQLSMLKLLWTGRAQGRRILPKMLQLFICLFILTVVSLQIVIACLSLSWSLEVRDNGYQWNHGTVLITDLDNSLKSDWPEAPEVYQRLRAREYGLASSEFIIRSVNWSPEIDTGFRLWYNENNGTMSCHLKDLSPDPTSFILASTKRRIQAKARCRACEIVGGAFSDVLTFNYTDPDTNTIESLVPPLGFIDIPRTSFYFSDRLNTCGNRCTRIYVYNSGSSESGDIHEGHFYKCENEISEVQSIDDRIVPNEYRMSDEIARHYAGAIGWSGIVVDNSSLEQATFPSGSSWAASSDDADTVAILIMKFSVGAVATVDIFGPAKNVSGEYPSRAQRLEIKRWWAPIAVLAAIPGVQFMFLLFVIYLANDVPIRDESYLSAAKLLQPIVEKLGTSGSLLTAKELAEVLGKERIVYGVRAEPDPQARNGSEASIIETSREQVRVDIIKEKEVPEQIMTYRWKPGREIVTADYA